MAKGIMRSEFQKWLREIKGFTIEDIEVVDPSPQDGYKHDHTLVRIHGSRNDSFGGKEEAKFDLRVVDYQGLKKKWELV